MEQAIIGAGLAGLTLARALSQTSRVRLYDKGRSVGGRLASRDLAGLRLNHGVTRFRLRGGPLQPDWLDDWQRLGLIAPTDQNDWQLLGGGRALSMHLQSELGGRCTLCLERQITRVARTNEGWWLTGRGPAGTAFHDGPFGRLIITCPAPQAHQLLQPLALLPDSWFRPVRYQPQWTLLALFAEPLTLSGQLSGAFDSLELVDQRGLVAQMSTAWTQMHLHLEKPLAAEQMLQALLELCPQLPAHRYLSGHRWLYAQPVCTRPEPALYLAEQQLGLAGDWFAAAGPGSDPGSGLVNARQSAQALLNALAR